VSLSAPARLPQPLTATGEVTHDPVTQSLLVRPAERGLAWLIWQHGHSAMMQDDGSVRGPRPVYARWGNRDVAKVRRCATGGSGFSFPPPIIVCWLVRVCRRFSLLIGSRARFCRSDLSASR
jgi:hypothetical protein